MAGYCVDTPHGTLDRCLKDILRFIKPTQYDQTKRQNVINELTNIVGSIENLSGVIIRPFGSFISELYTKWGDLDISIELSHSSPSSTDKRTMQSVLRDIMRKLRWSGVSHNVKIILHARVPLLIFESRRYNISCDLSVDNHMGYMKSRILKWIAEIDDRFRDVVLLTKEWAKVQNINDPKTGTLNSFSLCLLVIFHFQTCKPAILPPLEDIYEGSIADITGTLFSLERHIEDVCAANITRFKSFRERNQSTLCELLVSFFEKFSYIERDSSEYAICPSTGQFERIRSNPTWMKKSHNLLIEDPFERLDNAARAVSLRGLATINEAFMSTYQKLSTNSVLNDRNALLSILTRSEISSQLMVGDLSHYTARARAHGSREMHYALHAEVDQSPQTEYCGYPVVTPHRERAHRTRPVSRNQQTSHPAVARSRHGYTTTTTNSSNNNNNNNNNVQQQQQQWRPKNSNR